MKKKSPEANFEAPQESNSLSMALEENTIVQWISENGNKILFSFLGLIVGFLFIYKIAFGDMIKAENDFFQASQEYQLFDQKASTKEELATSNEAFQRLQKIMSRHSELKAKYDGLIAQTFLNRNEGQQAQPFAEQAIQRTRAENDPFFTLFSQTTLLIGMEKYEQALKQSIELKEKLANQIQPLLYGFNLLRIAALQHQLSLKKEELNTWQEWKLFVKNNDSINQNFVNHFKDGNVSINNYVEARENILRIKN
jgi:hypothetical protein